MDGRDAMAMSGPPYYLHREISQQQPAGIHGSTLPGMRSMPTPSLAMPFSGIGSGAFQVDSSPAVSSHSGSGGGGGAAGGGGSSQSEHVKRKRGRPRKYGPEGNVSLALSPLSSPSPGMALGSGSASGTPGQKRGRGRPPGTGRKQQLASLGEWVAGSAGMGFTPHIITIAEGEDIATKIMSFSQQGPRAICILSANGAVSRVTLRQPASAGGIVTYEVSPILKVCWAPRGTHDFSHVISSNGDFFQGRFEILCLSGSYMRADKDGSRSRSGGLNISLSSPDGRVIGGGVGGLLIAATPVQVIVGSFMHGGSKGKHKNKASHEPAVESDLHSGDKQSTPSALSNQNVITSSPMMGGWPGSRQLDMRNAHLDIDLTRG